MLRSLFRQATVVNGGAQSWVAQVAVVRLIQSGGLGEPSGVGAQAKLFAVVGGERESLV